MSYGRQGKHNYRASPGKPTEGDLSPLTDHRTPATRPHVQVGFVAMGMPAADGCKEEERRGGRIPLPIAAKVRRAKGPFSSSSADRTPPVTESPPFVRSSAWTHHTCCVETNIAFWVYPFGNFGKGNAWLTAQTSMPSRLPVNSHRSIVPVTGRTAAQNTELLQLVDTAIGRLGIG